MKANRRMGQWANRIIGVTFALAFATSASAQSELPTSPSWLEEAGATITFRAGVWSTTHELDSDGPFGSGMFWGKVTRSLNQKVSVLADGWLSVRGPFEDGHARGELREGFVTYSSGPIEIRAGRQIIAWGRADGINPTDNLTSQDFTALVPDDSDRRVGSTAVRLTYSFHDISATAIWLPEFRSHRIPVPSGFGDLEPYESDWGAKQFAVRVEQTGGAVDWSASVFHGRDLHADLQPDLSLAHNDVTVIGADAAGNLGRYGLRAEAAYVVTGDRHGIDPFIKNPFLLVVAGGDRTIGEHLNVNLQYLYKFVTQFEPPRPDPLAMAASTMSGQMRSHQHGASARVSYKWFHDTLEAEVAAAGYALPRGGVVRPKITYAVSDRMKLLVGGELYRGNAMSTFGMLRDNSGAFAEVRWSF